jgi:hypothetical protein
MFWIQDQNGDLINLDKMVVIYLVDGADGFFRVKADSRKKENYLIFSSKDENEARSVLIRIRLLLTAKD